MKFIKAYLPILIFLLYLIPNKSHSGDIIPPNIAVIIRIHGTLFAHLSDITNWKPAYKKLQLVDGCQIKTDSLSTAFISCLASGSRLKLNNDTHFEISSLFTIEEKSATNVAHLFEGPSQLECWFGGQRLDGGLSGTYFVEVKLN